MKEQSQKDKAELEKALEKAKEVKHRMNCLEKTFDDVQCSIMLLSIPLSLLNL